MIPNDNVAFVSLEGNKSESVKIKIGGKDEGMPRDTNIFLSFITSKNLQCRTYLVRKINVQVYSFLHLASHKQTTACNKSVMVAGLIKDL